MRFEHQHSCGMAIAMLQSIGLAMDDVTRLRRQPRYNMPLVFPLEKQLFLRLTLLKARTTNKVWLRMEILSPSMKKLCQLEICEDLRHRRTFYQSITEGIGSWIEDYSYERAHELAKLMMRAGSQYNARHVLGSLASSTLGTKLLMNADN